ncbi:hypothetical protein Tco_1261220 [Tanacetum coccineum]
MNHPFHGGKDLPVRTYISITMNFINEVVNGGVTIILFVVTNPVCVPKKRNLSIFRGLKGLNWKYRQILAESKEMKINRKGGQLVPISSHGLDMPRILLKERGAFGNADTGGAWLSSARATADDKPEEGEDDVKSSCPLCPGRHTCYNGRDKGSRSREGELTPKTRPQFGLQAATRLHEAGIGSWSDLV